jgi:hypothetical protein
MRELVIAPFAVPRSSMSLICGIWKTNVSRARTGHPSIERSVRCKVARCTKDSHKSRSVRMRKFRCRLWLFARSLISTSRLWSNHTSSLESFRGLPGPRSSRLKESSLISYLSLENFGAEFVGIQFLVLQLTRNTYPQSDLMDCASTDWLSPDFNYHHWELFYNFLTSSPSSAQFFFALTLLLKMVSITINPNREKDILPAWWNCHRNSLCCRCGSGTQNPQRARRPGTICPRSYA